MSAESLFSAHWHRVREVRARLASDVVVTRHVYRGRVSRVLHRRSARGLHRLDAASFELVDRLDGGRTVGEVWEEALLERDAAAPTQDEWIALLAALHAAELLVVDRRVPAERLFERRERRRAGERRERRSNPLYLRFALHDPDRWLTRLAPLARALFSPAALVLWLGTVIAGATALALDAGRLAATLSAPEFPSPAAVLLLLAVYPPLKLLHELAHALAVKRFGGAVHEVGIALMVLVPLPYVDASAAAAFPDKRHRMLVSAAGILVELACAAVGALLWSAAGGTLGDLGLALMLVGGFSTLLINGNPLLRFDGYYLLADALEIPNLASRSRRAALERLRTVLGAEPARRTGPEDRRERAWLLGYGVASALYRTGLMLWIAWWLSGRFLLFGALLALYAVVTSLVLPLARGLRALVSDPALRGARAPTRLAGGAALIGALALWLPLPHASAARGVIWLPEEALVRAAGDCEIVEASVRGGERVRAGQTLLVCLDPELALRERELLARADELDAHTGRLLVDDPLGHERVRAEREANRAALEDVRERIRASRLIAALDGRFAAPGTDALLGRSLARGDIAGYVVPDGRRTVRVALRESTAARIDAGPERVQLRVPTPSGEKRVHDSRILARTPRASRTVPSAALSTVGGGEHAAEPAGDGRLLREPVVDVELAWPEGAGAAPVGAHVDVRFVHAPAPLGARLGESLRRAFGERGRA